MNTMGKRMQLLKLKKPINLILKINLKKLNLNLIKSQKSI
jgi:hypothetical protein